MQAIPEIAGRGLRIVDQTRHSDALSPHQRPQAAARRSPRSSGARSCGQRRRDHHHPVRRPGAAGQRSLPARGIRLRFERAASGLRSAARSSSAARGRARTRHATRSRITPRPLSGRYRSRPGTGWLLRRGGTARRPSHRRVGRLPGKVQAGQGEHLFLLAGNQPHLRSAFHDQPPLRQCLAVWPALLR